MDAKGVKMGGGGVIRKPVGTPEVLEKQTLHIQLMQRDIQDKEVKRYLKDQIVHSLAILGADNNEVRYQTESEIEDVLQGLYSLSSVYRRIGILKNEYEKDIVEMRDQMKRTTREYHNRIESLTTANMSLKEKNQYHNDQYKELDFFVLEERKAGEKKADALRDQLQTATDEMAQMAKVIEEQNTKLLNVPRLEEAFLRSHQRNAIGKSQNYTKQKAQHAKTLYQETYDILIQYSAS